MATMTPAIRDSLLAFGIPTIFAAGASLALSLFGADSVRWDGVFIQLDDILDATLVATMSGLALTAAAFATGIPLAREAELRRLEGELDRHIHDREKAENSASLEGARLEIAKSYKEIRTLLHNEKRTASTTALVNAFTLFLVSLLLVVGFDIGLLGSLGNPQWREVYPAIEPYIETFTGGVFFVAGLAYLLKGGLELKSLPSYEPDEKHA